MSTSQFPSDPRETTIGDRVSDAAGRVSDKVVEIGRSAADGVAAHRDTAAGGLDTAASSLHAAADHAPGGERVQNFAHSAADTLSSTADYVRKADMARLRSDVEQVVKNNPVPALLTAAVVGFVVGRSLARND